MPYSKITNPVILWFTGLVWASTALAQSEGNVTVLVVDSMGEAMPCMVGKAVGIRGGADVTSHFDELRGTHIPYGAYTLNLFRTPLNALSVPIEWRIEVKQPDSLYIVVAPRIQFASGIVGDSQTPKGYEILGRVEPFEKTGPDPSWIRLVPIVGSTPTIDVGVNSLGEFHIYQVLAGRYLALVLRGGKILDVQEVVFERSSTGLQKISLALSNHAPILSAKPEDVLKQ